MAGVIVLMAIAVFAAGMLIGAIGAIAMGVGRRHLNGPLSR